MEKAGRMDDEKRLGMRASDGERQEVVDVLKGALDDGRLKMEEYLDRMGTAYEAVTLGDLAALHADLPAHGTVAKKGPAGALLHPTPPRAAVVASQGVFAGLPTALKVLWTIWLTAVSINVVVWVLVSVTQGSVAYPWPVWVAGPAGAALFGVSAGTSQIRKSRRNAGPPQLPPPGKH
jgi:hypothetical protein